MAEGHGTVDNDRQVPGCRVVSAKKYGWGGSTYHVAPSFECRWDPLSAGGVLRTPEVSTKLRSVTQYPLHG